MESKLLTSSLSSTMIFNSILVLFGTPKNVGNFTAAPTLLDELYYNAITAVLAGTASEILFEYLNPSRGQGILY